MSALLRFLFIAFLFAGACGPTEVVTNTPPSTIDAEDDLPASWEDWEWQTPDASIGETINCFDPYTGTPTGLCDSGLPQLPIDLGTDTGLEFIVDAGIDTGIDLGTQTCRPGQKYGTALTIQADPLLLAGCSEGVIIRAWGKYGEEYRSQPNQPLWLNVDADWYGYAAFNITCGLSWTRAVNWSEYQNASLENWLTITIDQQTVTPQVRICPYATGGVLIPAIPLACGQSPC